MTNNFKQESESESVWSGVVHEHHPLVEMNGGVRLVSVGKAPNHGVPKKCIRFRNGVENGESVMHDMNMAGALRSTKEKKVGKEKGVLMKAGVDDVSMKLLQMLKAGTPMLKKVHYALFSLPKDCFFGTHE